jgi:DNA-binding response OmpR family regulator
METLGTPVEASTGWQSPSIYSCGDVEVDCQARVARVAGNRQLLTYGEFEVLLRLIQAADRVLTREELNPHVRGVMCSPRSVDTYVTRLRRKLGAAQRFTIETVQRVGYRCHGSPSSAMSAVFSDDAEFLQAFEGRKGAMALTEVSSE